jgi:type IV fimbrial biogenesis protein FimT
MQRRHKHSNHADQAGFTLMELMITLFIVGVMVALAVPSFRSSIARNRLVTQTNDLVGALTIARSEAITRNRTMTFCRATAENSTTCAGSAGNWTFWIIRNSAGDVMRRGSIPTYGGGVRVTSNLTADTMTYSSDGLARTGAPAAMLIQTGINTHSLRVCVSTMTLENIRTIVPGIGSRLSTTASSGAC